MITRDDLLSAIAECKGQRDPNANTCIKLAAYQTILDHMEDKPQYSYAPEPAEQVRYDSGSEFCRVISGLASDDVIMVMDDLMDAVQVMMPKLYDATLNKLSRM